MAELQVLVEGVYTTRPERFHWDVRKNVECKAYTSTELGLLETTPDKTGAEELQYRRNDFVAVRHNDASDNAPFWIGKISRVQRKTGDQAM